jgi:predicted Zn-dependent protease with MMP-like domain
MKNVAIIVEQELPRPGMPDKITIFQGRHERLSCTRVELEQMVADTVWHEIAHHFGMDEQRVRRAERRRES